MVAVYFAVVLIVTGIVDKSHAAMVKTGGVNANLWSGIVMAVIAGGFVLWSRLRPIVVEEKPETPAEN